MSTYIFKLAYVKLCQVGYLSFVIDNKDFVYINLFNRTLINLYTVYTILSIITQDIYIKCTAAVHKGTVTYNITTL